MPLVNVMVNNRAYTIACDDGEEDHLRELAAHVDAKVKELLSSVGQVGEPRLLLMAALLIADEHHDVAHQLEEATAERDALRKSHDETAGKLSNSEAVSAGMFEAATRRLEDVVNRLAAA